ncbi:hypothetical protein HMPREF3191_01085 [Veillonellaceae bacterium DNF00626]|nr:hypothetical protein HMPREF3191_01085 [Veillonellaceae bacterium DNF00626]
MTMSDYVGKHILIDCYGCKVELMKEGTELFRFLFSDDGPVKIEVDDTYIHETNDEVIMAAYASRVHICIHLYPDMAYAAIDLYSFDSEMIPTSVMKAVRTYLKPERIRATSVKRGDMTAITDMKPSTKLKTTTMRKFRNTGKKINNAGKKVARYIVHNRKNRDDLGPE